MDHTVLQQSLLHLENMSRAQMNGLQAATYDECWFNIIMVDQFKLDSALIRRALPSCFMHCEFRQIALDTSITATRSLPSGRSSAASLQIPPSLKVATKM